MLRFHFVSTFEGVLITILSHHIQTHLDQTHETAVKHQCTYQMHFCLCITTLCILLSFEIDLFVPIIPLLPSSSQNYVAHLATSPQKYWLIPCMKTCPAMGKKWTCEFCSFVLYLWVYLTHSACMYPDCWVS